MLPPTQSPQVRQFEDLLDPRLIARLDRLDLRSARVFAGKLQGERRSKRRGRSVEFEDYRNYVSGDDLRFIDWNVYARLDRLFIKIFLEEEDLALHLALDASPSMTTGTPMKLHTAARLAAALAYVGLVGRNRVSLSVFGKRGLRGPGLAYLPECRGRHNARRAVDFLIEHAFGRAPGSSNAAPPDGARTGDDTGPALSFSEALIRLARTRSGKGVMVLLSDVLPPDGYHAGLRALAAAGGYDTLIAQILSPSELEPEREAQGDQGGALAGDLRLTDIETGRGAEVTMTSALLRQYKQRLEQYLDDLRTFAASREMSHMVIRSDADLENLLFDTLRRRGVVG